ncbi:hypothetical protein LguiA_007053 [Lonicera macranthoides]
MLNHSYHSTLVFVPQNAWLPALEDSVRFEEKIYAAATSQSDYLKKISLKMLTMKNKSNPMPNAIQSNSALIVKIPQIQFSDSWEIGSLSFILDLLVFGLYLSLCLFFDLAECFSGGLWGSASQVNNPGQSLPIPVPNNQSQAGQQLLSQNNMQNSVASTVVQGSRLC